MTATISGDGTSTLINLTTSGNTVLGDASTDTLNVGNGGLVKDASGNVGIGTSSPTQKLEVSGSGGVSLRVTSTNSSAQLILNSSGTNVGYINYNIGGAGALAFYDSNAAAERMRIDSSGRLLVATTSQLSPGGIGGYGNVLNPNNDGSWALALQNNATTTGNGRGIGIRNTTDFNDGNNEFIYCVGNATARMLVRSNGGISNYSANNVNLSDERTKTDIQDANDYLLKICAIPVRTFKYKDQTDDLLNLGCIAQEVEAVAPELVDASGFGETPEDGVPLKAIYQTDLQYALMKSIQELKALVDTQASTITALQADVAALKAQP